MALFASETRSSCPRWDWVTAWCCSCTGRGTAADQTATADLASVRMRSNSALRSSCWVGCEVVAFALRFQGGGQGGRRPFVPHGLDLGAVQGPVGRPRGHPLDKAVLALDQAFAQPAQASRGEGRGHAGAQAPHVVGMDADDLVCGAFEQVEVGKPVRRGKAVRRRGFPRLPRPLPVGPPWPGRPGAPPFGGRGSRGCPNTWASKASWTSSGDGVSGNCRTSKAVWRSMGPM